MFFFHGPHDGHVSKDFLTNIRQPLLEHLCFLMLRRDVERFTEGTELIGAAEVQLQSDLIR